jgi:hypothetical protein
MDRHSAIHDEKPPFSLDLPSLVATAVDDAPEVVCPAKEEKEDKEASGGIELP